jgi:hypothetical protein
MLLTAVGFVVGAQTSLFAGVVMSEVAVASGPIQNGTENQTVYVQGNKQKIDMHDIQTIADLDKGRLYIVDKTRRNYVEMPIGSLAELTPRQDDSDSKTVVLKRTGARRVIAENHCDEYRGNASNSEVHLTVSACVSTLAPGANEIVKFDRKMVSEVQGPQAGKSNEALTGMVLEKQSVINLRVPAATRKGYETALLVTKTRVNDIKVKELPAQTFMPPKGYSKVEQPASDGNADTQSIRFEQAASQLSHVPSIQGTI